MAVTKKGKEFDPIREELIRNRMFSAAQEMGAVMLITSGSPALTEAMDFSAGIWDAKGNSVAYAQYVTLHHAAMTRVMRTILDKYPLDQIRPGDMFVCNDPHHGGSMHPQDTSIMCPIFEKGQLYAWAGAEAHMIDVGGFSPGSFCVGVYDRYGEGLLMPPVKLLSEGKLNEELVTVAQNLSRVPVPLFNDWRSMMAANHRCELRMKELVDTYGLEELLYYMEIMRDLSEDLMRERISALPDGNYYFVEWQEHNGFADLLFRHYCKITVKGDEMIWDYEGTDPQTVGYINGTIQTVEAFIETHLMQDLAFDIPWNEGCTRPFTIKAPVGSIVCSVPPAGISSSHMDSGMKVSRGSQPACGKIMLMSEDELVRSRASSAFCESYECTFCMGLDSQYGTPFFFVDLAGGSGGSGAQTVCDGLSIGSVGCCVNNSIPDVEWNEHLAPILYLQRRINTNSGGAGQYRGGGGMEYVWIPWNTTKPINATINQSARETTPIGLNGGYPSSGGCNYHMRNTNVLELIEKNKPITVENVTGESTLLPQKVTIDPYDQEGDVFIERFVGGAGMGDPLFRAPAAVAGDILRHEITVKHAREAYGVIVDPKTLEVDMAATEKKRQEIRRARLARVNVKVPREEKIVEGKKVRPINWYLDLVEKEGQLYIVCNQCGTIICRKGEHWKDYAATAVSELAEILGSMEVFIQRREIPPRIMMVERFCPNCATMFEVIELPENQLEGLPIREEPEFLFGGE